MQVVTDCMAVSSSEGHCKPHSVKALRKRSQGRCFFFNFSIIIFSKLWISLHVSFSFMILPPKMRKFLWFLKIQSAELKTVKIRSQYFSEVEHTLGISSKIASSNRFVNDLSINLVQHQVQTCLDNKHSKNKWFMSSSKLLHRTHISPISMC